VTKHSLPISAEKYSRFKFGDLTIAKIYAVELFEYFINSRSKFKTNLNVKLKFWEFRISKNLQKDYEQNLNFLSKIKSHVIF
jgi:hypothetical protein